LQLDDSWKGNDQNDEIVQHVEDSQCKEKSVNVDAFSLGATKLCPEVGYWSARVAHGHPDDDGIGEC
jgi:hypothetical protein